MKKITDVVNNALSFEVNQATLSGAVDVIVVSGPDGTLKCTPFHVRFGKLKAFKTSNKVAQLIINGNSLPYFMRLGPQGDGYFSVLDLDNIEHGVGPINSEQTVLTPPETPVAVENVKKDPPQKKSFFRRMMGIFDRSKNGKNEKIQVPKSELPQPEKSKGETKSSQETESIIDLSLCGHLITPKLEESEISNFFYQNKVSYETFLTNPQNLLSDPRLMLRMGDSLYEWKVAGPIIISQIAFQKDLPESVIKKMILSQTKKNIGELQEQTEEPKSKRKASNSSINSGTGGYLSSSDTNQDNNSLSPKEAKEISAKYSRKISSESDMSDSSDVCERVLIVKSEILNKLNLKNGANTLVYRLIDLTSDGKIPSKSNSESNTDLEAKIYLYSYQTKFVISDIDGTITKTDVMGQLMPAVGQDWSHPGIIKLYNNIHKNGYEILYLTARAIGQSQQTRNFLDAVSQNNEYLPKGPLLMSPDRTYNSFKREVIQKRPEIFKIACLTDVRRAFAPEQNPFVAGFGNRETDAIAYIRVKVGLGNIFLVNPNGSIEQFNNSKTTTYNEINDKIELYFPLVLGRSGKYEFNDEAYWKLKYDSDYNSILNEFCSKD